MQPPGKPNSTERTNLIPPGDWASSVREKVIRWGKANYAPYPWRDTDSPWLALVAEVLLQRTNAHHVETRWDEIARLWPTSESVLRTASEDLALIDNLFGLNRRARTLRELAEYLDQCDHYPHEPEELLAIYGIGHYTTAAYLSLHMNRRSVLLDSNIARWITRMVDCAPPSDIRRKGAHWDIAERLTPSQGFKEYNYAVLDFTMNICRPRSPDCAACPLNAYCLYKHSASLTPALRD